MRIRTTITAALLLATLTACGTEPEADVSTDKPASSAPALSAEDRAAAREAAGLPPEPSPEARTAYLDALNAIDPRIIKPGKADQAVSRGLNQCSSIRPGRDRAELVQQTLERFTITTRFPDLATPETGEAILTAVQKHLCPNS